MSRRWITDSFGNVAGVQLGPRTYAWVGTWEFDLVKGIDRDYPNATDASLVKEIKSHRRSHRRYVRRPRGYARR